MMKLVLHLGVERMMQDISAEIGADFLRQPAFDKTPRVASHSDVGVIELMRTSDGQTYGFKYVNGHPSNMTRGLQTVTAFGLLAVPALAFKAICGISKDRLYDIDPAATAKCAGNLAGCGLTVIPCRSAQEAILGAGIITTVTADKTDATISDETASIVHQRQLSMPRGTPWLFPSDTPGQPVQEVRRFWAQKYKGV